MIVNGKRSQMERRARISQAMFGEEKIGLRVPI